MDEFVRANADPIRLVQNEMWEDLEPMPGEQARNRVDSPSDQDEEGGERRKDADHDDGDDIPF